MSWAIRDIRYNIPLENTSAPPPKDEVWAHVRRADPSAYGGTTNSGNIWIWTADQGFERLNANLAYGGWALAFGFDGYVYWQEQGINGVLRRQIYWIPDEDTGMLTPGPLEILDIAPSSAGLYDVTPDGVVVPDFRQPKNVTLEDGTVYTIPSCISRNGIDVGYANEGPIGVIGVRAGKLYTVWEGDPLSLPVRLDDDGLTAAVSGDLADGFIDFTSWKPRVVTPPDPIRPASDVIAFPRVSAAGSFVFPR